MYAHQVIEGLREERKRQAFDPKKIVSTIKDIQNAQHFHFNTVENTPPENLNKKRRKKSKQELFKYHTLQLQLPSKSKEALHIEDDSIKTDRRLHFCRGHFKTYTNENPLFGKHVGRYWWHPQIKGNKSEGFVMKDYSINRKKI